MRSLPTKMSVYAGARLDRLPISQLHKKILYVLGAGLFFDGMELYMAGGVLAALLQSGFSSIALNAQFISTSFAGMLIGAWSAGVIGDRYGRRAAYQINLLLFGAASLAGAAAPSMGWLIAARFFMGIGLGAESAIGYSTLSEFVPPVRRGRWLAILSFLCNVSFFIAALLGYWLIPALGWRWMFIIVGVGALFVWFSRRTLPESPRWLESQGRTEEADRVVRRFEEACVGPLPAVAFRESEAPTGHVGIRDLFSRRIWPRTFAAITVNVAMNTALYGFLAWIPSFLVKEGAGVVKSLQFSMAMSIGAPVGCLLAIFLSERVGRKRGVIISSVIGIGIGSIYPFVRSEQALMLIGFTLVTVFYFMISTGLAGYIPELFPTKVRLRGAGLASTVGRAGSMVTPYIIVLAYSHGGVATVLIILNAILLVQILAVAFAGVETRQKSLEALDPVAVCAGAPTEATAGVQLASRHSPSE